MIMITGQTQSSCPDLTQDIDSRPVPRNNVCKYNIKARIVYPGQSFAAAFSSRYDMPLGRGNLSKLNLIDSSSSITRILALIFHPVTAPISP